MEKNPYLLAAGALASTVVVAKFLQYNLSKEETHYDESKPQKRFKKYCRNNFEENSKIFFNEDDFIQAKKKIEKLDPVKMIELFPSVSLNAFSEDNFEYIDNEKSLSAMITQILKQDKVIGLDIEQTNTNTYHGYNCLIQISTISKFFIIDAIILHDVLPKYLKMILENGEIVKVFYAGSSDLQWLSRDYGIFVINFFDIYIASSFVSKQKDCSLVALLSEYCNHKINKEEKKKLQISDWRKRPLTKEQLNYAVLDIYYLIYLRNIFLEKIIQSKKPEEINAFMLKMQAVCLKPFEIKPLNLSPFVEKFNAELAQYKKKNKAELDKKNKFEWGEEKNTYLKMLHLRENLARELDTNPEFICSVSFLFKFAIGLRTIKIDAITSKILSIDESPGVLSGYVNYIEHFLKSFSSKDLVVPEKKKEIDTKENEKLLRKEKNEQKFTLQRKLYENCRVLAPDGELIAKTNRKKIAWYLSRDLGVLEGDDPPTIRLKFEPSKRGRMELEELNIEKEDYMENNRVNQCVVCGQEEMLSKYHIVPATYRQHFPTDLKSRRFYDVLLMCLRCRDKGNSEADKLKSEIAQRYNVPLVEFDRPQEIIQSVRCIQNILFSYSKHKSSMPKERRQKIKSQIREEFMKINKDSHLSTESSIAFEQFDYKNGEVKINEQFVNYFASQKNVKDFVQSSSNKDFKNLHGKLVIEKMQTPDEIKDFIEEWRMHFLNVMGPQFLPYDWKLALKEKGSVEDLENEDLQEEI